MFGLIEDIRVLLATVAHDEAPTSASGDSSDYESAYGISGRVDILPPRAPPALDPEVPAVNVADLEKNRTNMEHMEITVSGNVGTAYLALTFDPPVASAILWPMTPQQINAR